MSAHNNGPPSPDAHQVVSAGPGGGFGVVGRDGGLEPRWFDSKKAAEQFAEAQRKFFEGLDRAASQAASLVPASRPVPAFGGFPASIAPGGSPAPPGPWPATMFGAGPTGPPPAPPPTPNGPTVPIGPGGFPASMHGGYVPSPPAPAPTSIPPGIKDLFRDMAREIATALPHANGGNFDWVRVGESLARGIGKAAPIATAAGMPMPSADAAKFGAAIAKGFAEAAGSAGMIFAAGKAGGRLAEEANADNRHLRMYNGQIAGAFAALDFGEYRRNYQMAQATAGTTSQLARSVDAMRDAWMPTDIFMANMKNRAGIVGASYSAANGKVSSLLTGALDSAMEYVDPSGKTSSWLGWIGSGASWAASGAWLGSKLGPWGALAGAAGGLAIWGAGQAQPDPPKAHPDPWGNFLKDANNARPLRPARLVQAF